MVTSTATKHDDTNKYPCLKIHDNGTIGLFNELGCVFVYIPTKLKGDNNVGDFLDEYDLGDWIPYNGIVTLQSS